MSEFKCPFCGSNELKIKRITQFGPEVKFSAETGKDEVVSDFCCEAQRRNHKNALSYDQDSRPDVEEIGKW